MHLFKVEKEWSSENKVFPIILMGDFHVGSPNCDYDLLEQHVTEISNMPEETMVILMGDQAEWIIPGDRRFSIGNIDKRFRSKADALPLEYLAYLEELLQPIAHMIEVIHDGNHEKSMTPFMRPGDELCARLRKHLAATVSPEFSMTKLRYAPGEAFTKVHWKWNGLNSDHRSIMINTAHGWQAGRQPGAKHNEMAKAFAWIDADLLFRGHSHELFAEFGPPRCTPNPQMTKLVETVPICGHTGSYMKTREVADQPNYSELAGYCPLPKGYIRVDINLKDKGIAKSICIK